jgi:hypothetical protein
MKYNKNLPLLEKRHFMKCDCGEYFDMRDLEDVITHLHKYKAASELKVQFSCSIKVGESTIYTNKGKQLDLN